MTEATITTYEYNGEKIITCRACGRQTYFVKTQTGKYCPVSRATNQSHFLDCPAASRFSHLVRTRVQP